MKKLLVCFLAVLLLFCGCGKEKTENIELINFEYELIRGSLNIGFYTDTIYYIKLTTNININNCIINYNIYDLIYEESNIVGEPAKLIKKEEIDTNTIIVGSIKNNREYKIFINSFPINIDSTKINSLEIISATGTVVL